MTETDNMKGERHMSSLSEVFNDVRTKIAKHKGKNLCEADTKAALIHPVLGVLGWHVGNLDEVSMEFRHSPSHNPVDYALLISGNPTVLVEAKALGQSLAGGKWADAIMGYAGAAGVEWVVLTNGNEYRIYNACVPVPFEQKLFRKVSLTDSAVNETEETLGLLSRERIHGIKDQWERHFADRQVYAAIEKLFSLTSTKMLAHFVKKHVKGLTAKEIHASLTRVCAQVAQFLPTELPVPPVPPPPPPPPPLPTTLKEMIDAGIFKPPLKLSSNYKGNDLEAELLRDGTIQFQDKKYKSCSAAAIAAISKIAGRRLSANGWTFWQYKDEKGDLRPLDAARREYMKRKAK